MCLEKAVGAARRRVKRWGLACENKDSVRVFITHESARDVYQREASGAFRLHTAPDPRTSMLSDPLGEAAAAKRA